MRLIKACLALLLVAECQAAWEVRLDYYGDLKRLEEPEVKKAGIKTPEAFRSEVLKSEAKKTNTKHSPTGPNYCTSEEISSMNVDNCTCRPFGTKCFSKCPVCNIPVLNATKYTTQCDIGCVTPEAECEGCGIWFDSLCWCLKSPGKCNTNGDIRPFGDQIWVHLVSQQAMKDDLITTNELSTGILEMEKQPLKFNDGWVFAQTEYKPATQALALNSYRVRTQEQIHIHLCNRSTTFPGILDSETPNYSNTLLPLSQDPSTSCVTVPPNGLLKNFATNIAAFLRKSTCKELVGAGIIQDTSGQTWGCVTTISGGPLGIFCG